jgi:hypothetical protein
MSNPSPWPITPSIESTSLVTLFDQHTSTPTPYPAIGFPSQYLVPASGIIYLEEQPLQSSISIPTGVTCIEISGPHVGVLTEVLTVPNPGQFFVNYFNGSVQFGDTGATVVVTYRGIGSVVLAETINNMNTYIIDAASLAQVINPSSDLTNFTFTNVTVTGTLTAQAATSFDIVTVTNTDVGNTVTGQIWFNTVDKQFKGWNGTAIVILG